MAMERKTGTRWPGLIVATLLVAGVSLMAVTASTVATGQPATAESTPFPTATPPSLGTPVANNGDGPRVIEQRLIALPDNPRILSLSPDGRRFATIAVDDAQSLCVHDAVTLIEERCLGEDFGMLSQETIVWSPDGTRLAFTENSPVTFNDSDFRVWDISTGELTNLTDDRFEGGLPIFENDRSPGMAPVHADILPAWSPDGHTLAFVRSSIDAAGLRGTGIYRVAAAGGEPELVLRVSLEEPLMVYFNLFWSVNSHLIYTVGHADQDHPDNGIWRVGADGSDPRQLVGTEDPERGYPVVQRVSPRGDRAVGVYLAELGSGRGRGSSFVLVDLATGAVEPIEVPGSTDPDIAAPTNVGFSPDGGSLLLGTRFTDPDQQVLIRSVDDGSETLLLTGVNVTTATRSFAQGIDWIRAETVYLATSPFTGLLLTLDGVPTDPLPATPEPRPLITPTLVPVDFTVGLTVIVNDDGVPLRAAPSTDAPVVLDLAQGTPLTIIGPAREAGGFLWWPVEEPESGTIGYVRVEFLSAASAE